ncbi:hypothetical protein [Cellulophaga baltica]|uniref:hypothetical protein n=1 Tax=Cellulophaga baltica TaxID=76594 RepID=UPI0015F5312C|nr:hypothetical protein [Cellulophaga baltica]MBA6314210.1 hypothetical protein [Cellulophaga baltica]
MSYTISISRIDGSGISKEEFVDSIKSKDGLKFDDSQSWTNMYEFIILYKRQDESFDFLLGYNSKYKSGETISPDHPKWTELTEIADKVKAFIYGEENEIYYLPNIGKPQGHIDFESLKNEYQQSGLELNDFMSNKFKTDKEQPKSESPKKGFWNRLLGK